MCWWEQRRTHHRYQRPRRCQNDICVPSHTQRYVCAFTSNVTTKQMTLASGLVNPNCTGIIGNGVVIHLPSFFDELEALEAKGLNCTNRLFISDRAHLVFDFHQVVDGLKEIELGGSSIGTTKKGIGPAYSAKASRSGLRVHHLFDHDTFAGKFRKIVEGRFKRYGYFEYDTEREIERYKVRAPKVYNNTPLNSRDKNTDPRAASKTTRHRFRHIHPHGPLRWQTHPRRRRQRALARY